MTVLLIAVSASFFIGAMGYMIYRFWVRPIWIYRGAKRRTARMLTPFLGTFAEKPARPGAKALREAAMALSAAYHEELPFWYKLTLQRRGEDPVEAAKRLMTLSNTPDPVHALASAHKVRELLKIAASPSP